MATAKKLGLSAIVDAAIVVADREGFSAISMRKVARELGVEAMSLYHHIGNKNELLDRVVEAVIEDIELPQPTDAWREAMVARAHSARAVLSRHRWALGMLESRPTPSAALLRHHDRIIGCLLTNGFSAALATHAFSTIDAFIYGFVLTESSLPFEPGEGAEGEYAEQIDPPADAYPYLAQSLEELLGGDTFSLSNEFDAGLALILDGLEQQFTGHTPRD